MNQASLTISRRLLVAMAMAGCGESEASPGAIAGEAAGAAGVSSQGNEGGAAGFTQSGDAGSGGSAGQMGTGGAFDAMVDAGMSMVSSSAGSAPDVTDAGSSEPPLACLSPGELNCSEQASCCEGSECITDGVSVLCAAICTSNSECASECCAAIDDTTSVCAPAQFCPAPVEQCTVNEDCATLCCLPVDEQTAVCASADLCQAPPPVTCPDLVLLANDGTFLGEATSAITGDSVCNAVGPYGSTVSQTSIFNTISLYGNSFGTESAYSTFTFTPPVLFCQSTATFLNSVSKNTAVAGAIDPDTLCAVLLANGL